MKGWMILLWLLCLARRVLEKGPLRRSKRPHSANASLRILTQSLASFKSSNKLLFCLACFPSPRNGFPHLEQSTFAMGFFMSHVSHVFCGAGACFDFALLLRDFFFLERVRALVSMLLAPDLGSSGVRLADFARDSARGDKVRCAAKCGGARTAGAPSLRTNSAHAMGCAAHTLYAPRSLTLRQRTS